MAINRGVLSETGNRKDRAKSVAKTDQRFVDGGLLVIAVVVKLSAPPRHFKSSLATIVAPSRESAALIDCAVTMFSVADSAILFKSNYSEALKAPSSTRSL